MEDASGLSYRERYGPWALVVGGSAGIGAAAADEAAARGLNVLCVARRGELLEDRAAALRSTHGVEARILALDLLTPGATQAILEAASQIDVGLLIYNAAAEPRGYFLSLPVEEHLANIAVNCTIPTALAHHFGEKMVSRTRGGIVLVSSLGAFQGATVFASYFASKAYEWILGEGLWAEFRESGVDVLSYMVGATSTENYRGQQTGTGAASTATDGPPSVLDQRARQPSNPDQVGRHLFEILGREPTGFSHPDDQASAAAVGRLSRREAVDRMSALTSNIKR